MAEPVTLEILAKEIRDLWHQADKEDDENRIKLGRMLLQAQIRVHEAGEITWEKWIKRNVKRSDRDVRRLIGFVKDKTDAQARKALADERAKAAAAMRQSRGKAMSENAKDRTNVSPVLPDPQPASSRSSMTDTVTQPLAPENEPSSVEKIEELVKQLLDDELRELCDWLRDYEAERLGKLSSTTTEEREPATV